MIARWRYKRLLARMMGPRLLAAFARAYPRAVFVEIGANDGEMLDHLRPHILASDWTGVMVEPVPYVFERLARNYADVPGVQLAQVAVAASDGTVAFHHVAPGDGPARWYDGIGSLDRAAVLAHDLPEVAVVTTEVESVTYATLLERHGLGHVDLLVIDAEGYDWQILQTIEALPRLVVFEHFHLSEADRAAAHEHLRARGYETREEGFDTFALRPDDDAVTQAWRKLKPAVEGVSRA